MADELGRQLAEVRRGNRVVAIIVVALALAFSSGCVYLAVTKEPPPWSA